MIILFVNYDNINFNFNYIYNLFFYLKIKIKNMNNISDIINFIINNYDENDIYIFYEIFDINLFEYLKLKFCKNIYYFIDKKHEIEELNKLYRKLSFILISNNYKNLLNYNNEKIILSYQFDFDCKYEIEDLEDIIIFDNIDMGLEYFLINNNFSYSLFDNNLLYKNKIIIIDKIDNEIIINDLILNNNLLLIKDNHELKYYFFYNLFILYDKKSDLFDLIKYYKLNVEDYKNKYKDYINYFKKKLLINNKKFYQYIEKYEYIDSDFGFIILRHINSIKTNYLWTSNIKNIRKYYRNKIYIIDDNSNYDYLENNEKYKNVEIIESIFKSKGEILPYYYLYVKKLFKKCLIIHDSVLINNYIDFDKYNDEIHYLWHFGHNCNNLDGENEMMKLLHNNKIIEKYDEKKWYGCFGAQTIITYNFIEKIQKKFKIFNLLNYIDSRSKRMNFERIFSVLCTFIKEELYENKSIFGNIHDYIKWEYSYDEYLNDIKENKIDDYYLIKTWHGR